MRKQTNLDEVKRVAIALLHMDIYEDPYFPMTQDEMVFRCRVCADVEQVAHVIMTGENGLPILISRDTAAE